MVEWDFRPAAKALVAAQRRVVVGGGASNGPPASDLVELRHWTFEEGTCDVNGGCGGYLLHPPVLMPSRTLDPPSGTPFYDDGEVEREEIDFGALEEIAADCELISTAIASACEYTEWIFSVVFHATWRVPTLYFVCSRPDGTPLSRREVLDILLSSRTLTSKDGDEWSEEELWEFVSQEEHPISGKPSYFLHPCRTAERMELLLAQSRDQGDNRGGCPLLSWMSMIFPVVGCRIPPEVFCRLVEDMWQRQKA